MHSNFRPCATVHKHFPERSLRHQPGPLLWFWTFKGLAHSSLIVLLCSLLLSKESFCYESAMKETTEETRSQMIKNRIILQNKPSVGIFWYFSFFRISVLVTDFIWTFFIRFPLTLIVATIWLYQHLLLRLKITPGVLAPLEFTFFTQWLWCGCIIAQLLSLLVKPLPQRFFFCHLKCNWLQSSSLVWPETDVKVVFNPPLNTTLISKMNMDVCVSADNNILDYGSEWRLLNL